MKNNQPVTQHAIALEPHDRLISMTDCQGNIVEANEDFIRISGFSWEEIQNQPHNMVRHPDVPEAIFKDMWATLKSGQTWNGIVKNRAKNGDHYWVNANASPMLENGQLKCYVSVRRPATQEEINLAESVYPQIAKGTLSIKNGRIDNASALKNQQTSISLNQRVIIGQLLIFASVLTPLMMRFLGVEDGIAMDAALTLVTATISIFVYTGFRKYIINPVTELTETIEKANATGDLALRVTNLQGDEIGRLARSYSELMQNTQISVGFSNNVMRKVNHGIFDYQNTVEQKGDFEVIRNEANQAAQSVQHAMNALSEVLISIQNGDFSARMDESVKGDLRQQVDQTMTMLEHSIEEISTVMGNIAIGNYRQHIESEMHGEFAKLKGSINIMIAEIYAMVEQVIASSAALSAGDFNHKITGNFHGLHAALTEAVTNSTSNIASMFQEIKYSSIELSNNVVTTANGAMDLSQRTQEQAAAVEETAASMEQMTATVRQNTDSAMQAKQLADNARTDANHGNEVMTQTVSAINEIKDSSQRIADIIGMIDGIAFQTNLLALNAAVEAARAGDHGRGFAVVAGEVRSLAQKSADASKEIRVLIEDTVQKVEHGTSLVEETGSALSNINASIKKVSDIIAEISSASQEQSAGIDQVNKAIGEMDSGTQQNAALVEETSASTQSMEISIKAVNTLIDAFTIDTNQLSLGEAMNSGDFTFAKARRMHRAWVAKIRAFIYGIDVGINKAAAVDYTQCLLGKWLYSPDGQAYSHTEAFKTLEENHASLHAMIGRAVEAIENEDYETAENLLEQLEQFSHTVIEGINAVETQAHRSGIQTVSMPAQSSQSKTNKVVGEPRAQSQPASGDEWNEF